MLRQSSNSLWEQCKHSPLVISGSTADTISQECVPLQMKGTNHHTPMHSFLPLASHTQKKTFQHEVVQTTTHLQYLSLLPLAAYKAQWDTRSPWLPRQSLCQQLIHVLERFLNNPRSVPFTEYDPAGNAFQSSSCNMPDRLVCETRSIPFSEYLSAWTNISGQIM